jgi:hypothetical protein
MIHPPRWLRVIAWLASIATLLLQAAAGALAYGADYRGIDLPESDDACLIGDVALPVDAYRDDLFCKRQRPYRESTFNKANETLQLACKRQKYFEGLLKMTDPADPLARTALKQEKGVIQASFKTLREIVGPNLSPAIWEQLLLLAVTLAVCGRDTLSTVLAA